MGDGEQKTRELCPNLTTSDDLVNRIGALSVDNLNKDKVIMGLWQNIDEFGVNIKTLTEENVVLNNFKGNQEALFRNKEDEITQLKEARANYKNKVNKQFDEKNARIRDLEKILKTIEAEAVINQEEVRNELMKTRKEFALFKESLKPKKVKKKKINAKPARA